MVRLLNSAMIPQQGVYYAKKVSAEEARKLFEQRKHEGFVSYIGYPENKETKPPCSGRAFFISE